MNSNYSNPKQSLISGSASFLQGSFNQSKKKSDFYNDQDLLEQKRRVSPFTRHQQVPCTFLTQIYIYSLSGDAVLI